MTHRQVSATIVALASLLAPRASGAQTLDDRSAPDAGLHIGGSVRTVAAAAQPVAPSPTPSIGAFDETLLRITFDAHPTDRLTFEAHLVQSYEYSGVASAFGPPTLGAFSLVAGDARYRALDASTDWVRTEHHAASLWIDRLNVKIRLPKADVTIGRQAIMFGKTYFWNPLDEFLPFDARQIDRDYKPGVDAVRVDVPTGPFSGVNLVVAVGREIGASGTYRSGDAFLDASWFGSAVLGRYYTTARGWDLATQAGKVYGGFEAGGGAVGEIAHLEVRGEATYLWALPGLALPAPLPGRLIESHLAATAGVGKRFENTLSLELEHFHNGAANSQNLDAALVAFAAGAAPQLSREISAITVGCEFRPILTGNFGVLHSWTDGSTLLQPTVTYSLSENSDLIVGTAVGIGPGPVVEGETTHVRSEFGSFPRAAFVEFKLYF